MNRNEGSDGSEVFAGDYEELVRKYIDTEIGVVIDDFMAGYLSTVDSESDFYQRHFDEGEINERGLIFFGEVLNEFRGLVTAEYPGVDEMNVFLDGSAVNRRGFSLLLMNIMKNAIERSEQGSRMALDSLMEGYTVKNTVPGALAIKNKLLEMKKSGKIYGLISCDADHFKRVNDDYGHAVGDAVLKHLAKVIKASVRDCMPIRTGGEEIDLILNFRGDMESLLKVADRVRAAVSASPCCLQCKISDNGTILNFREIDEQLYQRVIESVTGETRQRRGIETVINERRDGSSMRTMFLMIPVSLSIGTDLIAGGAIDLTEQSDRDEVLRVYNGLRAVADEQCYLAKVNGRDAVYGGGAKYTSTPGVRG